MLVITYIGIDAPRNGKNVKLYRYTPIMLFPMQDTTAPDLGLGASKVLALASSPNSPPGEGMGRLFVGLVDQLDRGSPPWPNGPG